MARLAPPESPPPKYAVGVAYPALKLVLVSLVDPKSFEGTDLVEVLKHELAHVALEDAAGRAGALRLAQVRAGALGQMLRAR